MPNGCKRCSAKNASLVQQEAQPDAIQRVREAFADAIRKAPLDIYLYEGLANFLEVIKDPQGAIAAYGKICELMPNHFYACLQLGRLLREQGQPAQGEPFLEKAVQLRPSLPEGWFELGTVLAAQSKFIAALDCMERAARLRPQDASYVCSTGQMLAKLNRHAEAIERYRQAIQMNPNMWEAHFELANELVATRSAGGGPARILRRAQNKSPSCHQPLESWGDAGAFQPAG